MSPEDLPNCPPDSEKSLTSQDKGFFSRIYDHVMGNSEDLNAKDNACRERKTKQEVVKTEERTEFSPIIYHS